MQQPHCEYAVFKRALSQLSLSHIASTVRFNVFLIQTTLSPHFQAPIGLNLIQCTSHPPLPFLSFLSLLLFLLLTDQGSACSVSISHVSFLPASETLIQGQGLPWSHFPSLPEWGCSGWPYLLSLLSQILAGGGPLTPNSTSLHHTQRQHIGVVATHTHTAVDIMCMEPSIETSFQISWSQIDAVTAKGKKNRILKQSIIQIQEEQDWLSSEQCKQLLTQKLSNCRWQWVIERY